MTEKRWYHNDIVSIVGAFACMYVLLSFANYLYVPPLKVLPFAGAFVNQEDPNHPTFEMLVWHQHPAKLKDVVVFARVNGEPGKPRDQWAHDEHTLETWGPNRDQGIRLRFKLKPEDLNRTLEVSIDVVGRNIATSNRTMHWERDHFID